MNTPGSHWGAVLVLTALTVAAAVWIALAGSLSPLERSLVGNWSHTNHAGPWVLELHADRSCVSRRLDDAPAFAGGLRAMTGRWRVHDGALECDWSPKLSGYVTRFLWSNGQRMGRVVVVAADRFDIAHDRGIPTTYTRHGD